MTPPKTRYTKDRIIEEAFGLVEEKGVLHLSARNVAKKLGMSQAPIYSYFGSMDSLAKEVLKKGEAMLLSYTKKQYTDRIFLNIGVGIVLFARDHPNIYKAIFIEGAPYKDIVDEFMREVDAQMAKDARFTDMPKAERNALRSRMWLFTHGLASMTSAKLIKRPGQKDIVKTLLDIGGIVITAALNSSKKK